MKSPRHILIIVLLAMSIGTGAAEEFDNRLDNFLQQPTATTANSFFDLLCDEEFTDERISFGDDTPADTLRREVYYWAAEYLYDQQQYDQAKDYGAQALKLFPATDAGQEKFDCLNLMAIIHVRLADNEQAADYAKQAYALGLKTGDADQLSSCLNTLAGIYLSANMPNEAEQYVLKGIDYCQKAGNENRLAILNSMASEIYHALDNQQRALEYATRARDIDRRLGNNARVAVRESLMGAALVGLGRLDEAHGLLESAIPQLAKAGNYHSLAIACNKMGELLINQKHPSEAVPYFRQAAQIFEAMGDSYNELHSQLGLYNALKDSLPAEAKQHFMRWNALKDTIYRREAAQTMGRTSAEMGNAELKAQQREQQARARRNILTAIGIIALLTLAVLFLFWQLRRKTREFMRQFEQLQKTVPQESANDTSATEDSPTPTLNDDDRQFLHKLDTLVSRQIEEGHVDVRALASEMCMSITAFRRRFTALIGDKPQAYVMRLRMEKACQMMEASPDANIADIGMRLGFDDKSNFTRAFKRVVGTTPSEYLKSKTSKPETTI